MKSQKTIDSRASEKTARLSILKRLRRFIKRLCIMTALLAVGVAAFFVLRPEGQFTLAAGSHPADNPNAVQIKLLTWNILRGGEDSTLEMNWHKRKDAYSTLLETNDYDVLCFQEVLPEQLAFFSELLPDCRYVAAGRQDGKSEGEHCPIFYRTDRFDLVQSETFWLSPDPDTPGSGWGEPVPRICTWVELQDKTSGRRFRIYNTHLPVHPYAQYRAAKLLAQRIEQSPVPAVLAGDLNAPPDWPPLKELENADLRSVETSGALTYHINGKGVRCLDHILHGPHWNPRKGGLIKDNPNGAYPSDHFGLWATLELPVSN